MGRKKFAVLAVLAALWTAVGQAQPATPEAIAAAHGGLSGDLEIHGVVESVDADGGVVQSPFTLKLSGDRSRLETAGKVFVRDGVFGQWWREGGPRSTPKRTWEGLREVYLTPFYPVAGLAGGRRVAAAGRIRFSEVLKRNTHIGFSRPDPVVELDFDPATLLLEEGRFGTADNGQSQVTLRYSDYTRVRGAAIPRRIERQVGDNPSELFKVETVTFNSRFSEDEFRIEP